MKEKNNIFNTDARSLHKKIEGEIVDVTISSPPYFNLKDYGSDNQIGYGQNYEDYLNDIGEVFDAVKKVTKKTGTLWIIVDTFRKDGEVYPLPFDMADVLKKKGWILQDIIIWSKERTVPWAHKGQMRSMFEYVLVFSKTKNFKYYMERIREIDDLKKWWVKYPERYNPSGKAPTEIWTYDIPTQGSWGNGYIKHFCPLPAGLVQRIIELTTDEGDLVLDPFSGSGTVPSQALFMKRDYVGFELNGDYIKLFKKYIRSNTKKETDDYKKRKSFHISKKNFTDLILKLRVLKLAGQLFRRLNADDENISSILVEKSSKKQGGNGLISAKYTLYCSDNKKAKKVKKKIDEMLIKPPLSKYGVNVEYQIVTDIDVFKKRMYKKVLYAYKARATHCFEKKHRHEYDLPEVLSSIRVAVEEKEHGW